MVNLRGKLFTSTALVSVGFALLGGSALALPQQGSVAGGSAVISQSAPDRLDITQNSDKAVIDWRSFSVGAGETTAFHQPSASSVAVNRVTGVDPSAIAGNLTANGQVVLVNPNGIVFDKGSQVNVGGLVASTSSISTANAMAGNYVFDRKSSSSSATIINRGSITAAQGGLVALVAPGVRNDGIITANLGKVSLASGNTWTLDMYGDHLVSFAASDKVMSQVIGPDGKAMAGVTDTGRIVSHGGTVELTANVAKGVVDNAINMSGVIEANSVHSEGGTIVLGAADNGIAVSGRLDASGATGGGTIVVGSEHITDPASGVYGLASSVNVAQGSVAGCLVAQKRQRRRDRGDRGDHAVPRHGAGDGRLGKWRWRLHRDLRSHAELRRRDHRHQRADPGDGRRQERHMAARSVRSQHRCRGCQRHRCGAWLGQRHGDDQRGGDRRQRLRQRPPTTPMATSPWPAPLPTTAPTA